jgi:CubicO group peptidase (beta-lactamase class C family)
VKTKKLILLLTILFLFFLFSCEKEETNLPISTSGFISTGTWIGDYWPTEEWRTCTPEEVGMDSEKLDELNDDIQLLLELHIDVHSVVVVKNGYIIAEQYYSGDYGIDSLHRIHSCTKSITSALLGIAIEQGYISNENTLMTSYFPEYEIENMTSEKQQITLKHLLTMSAGLEWYEVEYLYSDERNTYRQWISSDDKVKFVLDRPTITSPGEEYSYNTGISHLLSAIIEKSTGTKTDSFALKNIFKPLGIKDYYWPIDNRGITYGGNGAKLKPRDLAKFGYLFLKNGMWDGNQIVPENWVETSQQKHINRKYIPNYYYGYHWWVSNQNSYSAVGYAGQWLIIIPENDLVVVFNNQFTDGDDLQMRTPERLLNNYIIPAIK